MDPSPSTTYDIAIIGAGVVGCAVARRFALAGAKVVVIEKGPDILSGASKANSAILHTGFDAPEGSLELDLVKAGRAEYLSIHGQMGLSLVETGALVCAWSAGEAESLEQIAGQGQRNGIGELRLVTARQARGTTPGLSDHLIAALEVPGEHVIDPWSAPLAYLTQAVALGTQLVRNAEVLSGEFDGKWRIETTAGAILAASVVNAAGLYGDIVDARLGLVPDFTIKPRKGQFVVLDKAARRHVPRIILPVPTEITKGVVVCPTAFGNVLIGPTAEEQDDRERATVETAALEALLARGTAIIPALASVSVTAVYAGLRPASEMKHYRISARPDRRAITLGGVRSTGLSAALGLAQHALSLHESFGTHFEPPAAVPDVTMPNITETCERDWQRADHGEIICHCELVTRREIEATFASPIPPGDFGGLRRRTRAGMGRCQGFYCNARLAAMTGDRLAVPLAVPPGDGR
ncbi:NAD(P)/FAD-dependent oxidoreductase [Agrobacterium larrymoorei]|uniref:Glycerol-3-phosphate dehydrogenase n=1 Tax=Agrobacterium larrymoorei TaxID=160699 RepID=A0ABU0UDJ4_9HYPH|nr:NAD(P)/FAD-dependent oxidoreductase [Agrobacterium larrymoorei]MDQ1182988.1 glycerol-3-phosphate dehydrogenase [Agrobacterium larrymoorei]